MSYYILGDNEPIRLALSGEGGASVDMAGASAVIVGRCGNATFSASATIDGSAVYCSPPSALTVGTWQLQAVITFATSEIRTYPRETQFVPMVVIRRVNQ